MIEIRTQVYRRRIDRNSPTGRSSQWVPTVSQRVRQLTPEQVREWESIVRSVSARQQPATS